MNELWRGHATRTPSFCGGDQLILVTSRGESAKAEAPSGG